MSFGQQDSYRQRRRSPRVAWHIPIIITWQRIMGLTMREEGETEVVNAHGALIRLSTLLPRGDIIKVMRRGARTEGLSRLARVVNARRQESEGKIGLGIELVTPSMEFWTELAR